MSKTKTEIVIPPGKLWPKTPSGALLDIEVLGVTGEFQSGKTIMILSIAPGNHPPVIVVIEIDGTKEKPHPFAGKPRTLYLDFEKSGGTYGGTGCLRIDVPQKMLEQGKSNYTPYDVFVYFLSLIEKMAPGQFDVIAADPITDIESGLVEYVKRNCGQFGLTPAQITKGGGLLWGAVKDYWKQVLLKLSTRCQCFAFTSHLRDVWAGNTPTGKREPKGKETLMELASLYLWLERKPDEKGNVSAVPSATVLKQRLADTFMDAEGNLHVVNLLPPRLPVATVSAIRGYIANPPDYQKLKDGERVIEEKLTEAEILRMKMQLAETEKEVEVSRLEQMRRRAEIQAAARQAENEAPQNTDMTVAQQLAKAAQKEAEIKAKNEAEANAKAEKSAAQDAEIARLKAESAAKLQEANAMKEKLMAEQTAEHSKNGQPGPGLASKQQVNEVKTLVGKIGFTKEEIDEKILKPAKVNKVSEMKKEVCHLLIGKLEKKLASMVGKGLAVTITEVKTAPNQPVTTTAVKQHEANEMPPDEPANVLSDDLPEVIDPNAAPWEVD